MYINNANEYLRIKNRHAVPRVKFISMLHPLSLFRSLPLFLSSCSPSSFLSVLWICNAYDVRLSALQSGKRFNYHRRCELYRFCDLNFSARKFREQSARDCPYRCRRELLRPENIFPLRLLPRNKKTTMRPRVAKYWTTMKDITFYQIFLLHFPAKRTKNVDKSSSLFH